MTDRYDDAAVCFAGAYPDGHALADCTKGLGALLRRIAAEAEERGFAAGREGVEQERDESNRKVGNVLARLSEAEVRLERERDEAREMLADERAAGRREGEERMCERAALAIALLAGHYNDEPSVTGVLAALERHVRTLLLDQGGD